MQIDFNLLVIFHLVVVVQGFTTALLLWRSGYESPKFRYLSLLVLAMTAQTVDSFLISAGIYRDHHSMYFFPLFYSWSYGALFYFYLKDGKNPVQTSLTRHLWHWLPVAIQFTFYAFIFVQNLDFKTWFWFEIHSKITRYVDVYVGIFLVFAYGFASFGQLKKTEPMLRRFFMALGIFFGLALIDPMINYLYLPEFSPKFYLIQYIVPIFTFWLSLSVYLRDQKTHRRSQGSESTARHFLQITGAIETQSLYLRPELSLPELAEAVGLNTTQVSAAINLKAGLSFNDFVNQYRVEQVKLQIQEGAHQRLTLLGIGLDSGFNSKNTFNRAFKKFTGLSPSEYVGSIESESGKSSVKL